ncbi:MAG: sugar transferase [Rubrobacteridae bacterium]|nr:sugar transferase [Rubrobacteridae bacterium]
MIKRVFDFILALLAVIILAPVFICTAIAVRVKMGSPVIFRQYRPGLNGKPFKMLKFRSMTDEYDGRGELISPAKRVTPLGKFLRDYSLDELPELFNVLKGDMSLVGPRPLLMEYLGLYSKEEARRHEVKPGVTGWGQINGRNGVTWQEKFAMDVWYVDNRSILLDLKILWLTVSKVIKREDIDTEGFVGMPKFTGSGGQNPSNSTAADMSRDRKAQ